MSAAAHPFQPARAVHRLRRQAANVLAMLLCAVFAVFAVGVLLYLLWYLVQQGSRFINLDFFTKLPPAFGDSGGGMGEAVVEQLVQKNMVSNFADIYKLKESDLLLLEHFKHKKAHNLLAQIEKSKQQPLHRLLFGLGIHHVGEKASLVLAEKFGTIDHLMQASLENLIKIPEIGPVMAESVVEFFKQSSVQILIKNLKEYGVNTKEPHREKGTQPLAGKTFVFTGELKNFTRAGAEEKVVELGGNPSSSVSKKTDYVVAGENPGSKYTKAQKLGVKIINEEEFEKLLK